MCAIEKIINLFLEFHEKVEHLSSSMQRIASSSPSELTFIGELLSVSMKQISSAKSCPACTETILLSKEGVQHVRFGQSQGTNLGEYQSFASHEQFQL